MQHHRTLVVNVLLSVLAVLTGAAWAGRPLGVDDANIDDKGTGHVEAWFSREAGSANVFNVAPAYSPWEAVELSGQLTRDRTNSVTLSALLARARITESRPSGCNVLVALGAQHANPGGNQPFGYTALTCNRGEFALHANLGAAKPSGGSSYGTWGIALERDHGDLVGHVEAFGQEGVGPTFQVGARKSVARNWQIDGTVGRTAGDTIFSVGFKVDF